MEVALVGSKDRLRWAQLPPSARASIERLVGATVADAQNCAGGYSPGLAARVRLADGRRAFVKAVLSSGPAHQRDVYRAESVVASQLPAEVPAPRFIGAVDDGELIALAFEDIEGSEPIPWTAASLHRVLDALVVLAGITAPSLLPADHPRLGGWTEVDPLDVARVDGWAAAHLEALVALENAGREVAKGTALGHFDLYAHNILLSEGRAVFVDWPHARPASAVVDVVTVLVSASADGLDATPFATHPAVAAIDSPAIDPTLAAVAGYLISGALAPLPPELAPIAAEKERLGLAALAWLRQRWR